MKIILVCNAGMSTGIMQVKLQECAQKDGIEAEITAMPISEIDTFNEDVDVVLLGPQIRFAEDDLRKTFENKAYVYCIDIQDFGLMRAENVWNKIKDKCM
ncbi:PTS sugar transporter subunit IIB [Candidatus Stoquefichus massiliensis]|uniref:PTS sugar transporter subunit IIB n=1 Tax=Candidatus Stoquefichus massiliensis TaxID=1470350 RepID=UPI0004876703|nr:PTS sugar transporter subunit IIB [Candidatus Stoquefichus massiliensis]